MRRVVLLAALALSAAGLASAAEPRTSPVGVGDTAPGFTLQDQNGQKVQLSASQGHPAVLVFYRGSW